MAQLRKYYVQVTKTARFYVLNSVQQQTKNIWVVFHGYGQLAEYFLKHFTGLDPQHNAVIALEGLSRFYVEGLSGRVGASWMTKEDREEEILDQSTYVNTAIAELGIDLNDPDHRIVILGFSQGTATAIRWMANNKIRPHQLIIWAGSFPHDVDPKQQPDIFKNLSTHFVHGDEDPFIQHLDVKQKMDEFKGMGMDLRIWPFNGKHTMDRPTLQKIVDSFDDELTKKDNHSSHTKKNLKSN